MLSFVCFIYYCFIGLIIYSSDNKPHYYDIAEAPVHLNQTTRIKSLSGTFKISFDEKGGSNQVQCHDLRQVPDPKYSIDELYESNVNIVAVLLINSTDSLTLDSQLDLNDYCVLVPVYVISCVQGDEIIHHIKTALGDCFCQFEFSSTDDREEYKPKRSHGNSLLAFIIIINYFICLVGVQSLNSEAIGQFSFFSFCFKISCIRTKSTGASFKSSLVSK